MYIEFRTPSNLFDKSFNKQHEEGAVARDVRGFCKTFS